MGRHLDSRESAFGRLFGKVKADERFFGFGFASGMEVILDDEIGSFANLEAEARGIEMRLTADGPAADANSAVSDAHAAETGLGALLRFFVNFAVRVGEVEDMVDDRAG